MSPGPGQYYSPDRLGTGPHYTIAGKPVKDHDDLLPGPGQYDPNDD